MVVCARPLYLSQNNLHELWALLNFLLPSVFKDSEAFSKVFDLNVDDADKKQNMIKQLHKILRCDKLHAAAAATERWKRWYMVLKMTVKSNRFCRSAAHQLANPQPQHQGVGGGSVTSSIGGT